MFLGVIVAAVGVRLNRTERRSTFASVLPLMAATCTMACVPIVFIEAIWLLVLSEVRILIVFRPFLLSSSGLTERLSKPPLSFLAA